MKRIAPWRACLLVLFLVPQLADGKTACAKGWKPGPVVVGEEVSYNQQNYRATQSAATNTQPPNVSPLYALLGPCDAATAPRRLHGPHKMPTPIPAPKLTATKPISIPRTKIWHPKPVSTPPSRQPKS